MEVRCRLVGWTPRPAGLGAHRRQRPDHPHRRDQPAQCVPGRRFRYRRRTCCSPCVLRWRRRTRESAPTAVPGASRGWPRPCRPARCNGARGNSGVILSQILRGIADVTATAAADAGGELPHMDAVLLGAALRRGVELVITSMGGEEVPGTIVSVLRAAAGAVEECAAGGAGRRRSSPAATRRWSRWRRPPSSSTCSPTPVRWTPAGVACWCCWTR